MKKKLILKLAAAMLFLGSLNFSTSATDGNINGINDENSSNIDVEAGKRIVEKLKEIGVIAYDSVKKTNLTNLADNFTVKFADKMLDNISSIVLNVTELEKKGTMATKELDNLRMETKFKIDNLFSKYNIDSVLNILYEEIFYFSDKQLQEKYLKVFENENVKKTLSDQKNIGFLRTIKYCIFMAKILNVAMIIQNELQLEIPIKREIFTYLQSKLQFIKQNIEKDENLKAIKESLVVDKTKEFLESISKLTEEQIDNILEKESFLKSLKDLKLLSKNNLQERISNQYTEFLPNFMLDEFSKIFDTINKITDLVNKRKYSITYYNSLIEQIKKLYLHLQYTDSVLKEYNLSIDLNFSNCVLDFCVNRAKNILDSVKKEDKDFKNIRDNMKKVINNTNDLKNVFSDIKQISDNSKKLKDIVDNAQKISYNCDSKKLNKEKESFQKYQKIVDEVKKFFEKYFNINNNFTDERKQNAVQALVKLGCLNCDNEDKLEDQNYQTEEEFIDFDGINTFLNNNDYVMTENLEAQIRYRVSFLRGLEEIGVLKLNLLHEISPETILRCCHQDFIKDLFDFMVSLFEDTQTICEDKSKGKNINFSSLENFVEKTKNNFKTMYGIDLVFDTNFYNVLKIGLSDDKQFKLSNINLENEDKINFAKELNCYRALIFVKRIIDFVYTFSIQENSLIKVNNLNINSKALNKQAYYDIENKFKNIQKEYINKSKEDLQNEKLYESIISNYMFSFGREYIRYLNYTNYFKIKQKNVNLTYNKSFFQPFLNLQLLSMLDISYLSTLEKVPNDFLKTFLKNINKLYSDIQGLYRRIYINNGSFKVNDVNLNELLENISNEYQQIQKNLEKYGFEFNIDIEDKIFKKCLAYDDVLETTNLFEERQRAFDDFTKIMENLNKYFKNDIINIDKDDDKPCFQKLVDLKFLTTLNVSHLSTLEKLPDNFSQTFLDNINSLYFDIQDLYGRICKSNPFFTTDGVNLRKFLEDISEKYQEIQGNLRKYGLEFNIDIEDKIFKKCLAYNAKSAINNLFDMNNLFEERQEAFDDFTKIIQNVKKCLENDIKNNSNINNDTKMQIKENSNKQPVNFNVISEQETTNFFEKLKELNFIEKNSLKTQRNMPANFAQELIKNLQTLNSDVSDLFELVIKNQYFFNATNEDYSKKLRKVQSLLETISEKIKPYGFKFAKTFMENVEGCLSYSLNDRFEVAEEVRNLKLYKHGLFKGIVKEVIKYLTEFDKKPKNNFNYGNSDNKLKRPYFKEDLVNDTKDNIIDNNIKMKDDFENNFVYGNNDNKLKKSQVKGFFETDIQDKDEIKVQKYSINNINNDKTNSDIKMQDNFVNNINSRKINNETKTKIEKESDKLSQRSNNISKGKKTNISYILEKFIVKNNGEEIMSLSDVKFIHDAEFLKNLKNICSNLNQFFDLIIKKVYNHENIDAIQSSLDKISTKIEEYGFKINETFKDNMKICLKYSKQDLPNERQKKSARYKSCRDTLESIIAHIEYRNKNNGNNSSSKLKKPKIKENTRDNIIDNDIEMKYDFVYGNNDNKLKKSQVKAQKYSINNNKNGKTNDNIKMYVEENFKNDIKNGKTNDNIKMHVEENFEKVPANLNVVSDTKTTEFFQKLIKLNFVKKNSENTGRNISSDFVKDLLNDLENFYSNFQSLFKLVMDNEYFADEKDKNYSDKLRKVQSSLNSISEKIKPYGFSLDSNFIRNIEICLYFSTEEDFEDELKIRLTGRVAEELAKKSNKELKELNERKIEELKKELKEELKGELTKELAGEIKQNKNGIYKLCISVIENVKRYFEQYNENFKNNFIYRNNSNNRNSKLKMPQILDFFETNNQYEDPISNNIKKQDYFVDNIKNNSKISENETKMQIDEEMKDDKIALTPTKGEFYKLLEENELFLPTGNIIYDSTKISANSVKNLVNCLINTYSKIKKLINEIQYFNEHLSFDQQVSFYDKYLKSIRDELNKYGLIFSKNFDVNMFNLFNDYKNIYSKNKIMKTKEYSSIEKMFLNTFNNINKYIEKSFQDTNELIGVKARILNILNNRKIASSKKTEEFFKGLASTGCFLNNNDGTVEMIENLPLIFLEYLNETNLDVFSADKKNFDAYIDAYDGKKTEKSDNNFLDYRNSIFEKLSKDYGVNLSADFKKHMVNSMASNECIRSNCDVKDCNEFRNEEYKKYKEDVSKIMKYLLEYVNKELEDKKNISKSYIQKFIEGLKDIGSFSCDSLTKIPENLNDLVKDLLDLCVKCFCSVDNIVQAKKYMDSDVKISQYFNSKTSDIESKLQNYGIRLSKNFKRHMYNSVADTKYLAKKYKKPETECSKIKKQDYNSFLNMLKDTQNYLFDNLDKKVNDENMVFPGILKNIGVLTYDSKNVNNVTIDIHLLKKISNTFYFLGNKVYNMFKNGYYIFDENDNPFKQYLEFIDITLKKYGLSLTDQFKEYVYNSVASSEYICKKYGKSAEECEGFRKEQYELFSNMVDKTRFYLSDVLSHKNDFSYKVKRQTRNLFSYLIETGVITSEKNLYHYELFNNIEDKNVFIKLVRFLQDKLSNLFANYKKEGKDEITDINKELHKYGFYLNKTFLDKLNKVGDIRKNARPDVKEKYDEFENSFIKILDNISNCSKNIDEYMVNESFLKEKSGFIQYLVKNNFLCRNSKNFNKENKTAIDIEAFKGAIISLKQTIEAFKGAVIRLKQAFELLDTGKEHVNYEEKKNKQMVVEQIRKIEDEIKGYRRKAEDILSKIKSYFFGSGYTISSDFLNNVKRCMKSDNNIKLDMLNDKTGCKYKNVDEFRDKCLSELEQTLLKIKRYIDENMTENDEGHINFEEYIDPFFRDLLCQKIINKAKDPEKWANRSLSLDADFFRIFSDKFNKLSENIEDKKLFDYDKPIFDKQQYRCSIKQNLDKVVNMLSKYGFDLNENIYELLNNIYFYEDEKVKEIIKRNGNLKKITIPSIQKFKKDEWEKLKEKKGLLETYLKKHIEKMKNYNKKYGETNTALPVFDKLLQKGILIKNEDTWLNRSLEIDFDFMEMISEELDKFLNYGLYINTLYKINIQKDANFFDENKMKFYKNEFLNIYKKIQAMLSEYGLKFSKELDICIMEICNDNSFLTLQTKKEYAILKSRDDVDSLFSSEILKIKNCIEKDILLRKAKKMFKTKLNIVIDADVAEQFFQKLKNIIPLSKTKSSRVPLKFESFLFILKKINDLDINIKKLLDAINNDKSLNNLYVILNNFTLIGEIRKEILKFGYDFDTNCNFLNFCISFNEYLVNKYNSEYNTNYSLKWLRQYKMEDLLKDLYAIKICFLEEFIALTNFYNFTTDDKEKVITELISGQKYSNKKGNLDIFNNKEKDLIGMQEDDDKKDSTNIFGNDAKVNIESTGMQKYSNKKDNLDIFNNKEKDMIGAQEDNKKDNINIFNNNAKVIIELTGAQEDDDKKDNTNIFNNNARVNIESTGMQKYSNKKGNLDIFNNKEKDLTGAQENDDKKDSVNIFDNNLKINTDLIGMQEDNKEDSDNEGGIKEYIYKQTYKKKYSKKGSKNIINSNVKITKGSISGQKDNDNIEDIENIYDDDDANISRKFVGKKRDNK